MIDGTYWTILELFKYSYSYLVPHRGGYSDAFNGLFLLWRLE